MDALRKKATSLFFPPSPKPQRNHSVFLSFRGQDTRKCFIDHLYNALRQAGVQVFKDDNGLPRGKEISTGLRKAIQESRICIVVFSKNYACSRWCLDELLEILECKKVLGHIVLPVFYNVDPSYVRRWQKVNFEDAFVSHEQKKCFGTCFVVDDQMAKRKVDMWQAALRETANISGYCLNNDANGHEAKLVEIIVTYVLQVVDPNKKSKDPKIFGEMKTHLSLLSIENNLRVNGMMGNISKTIVSNGVAGIVTTAIAPHGNLARAATTVVANFVADKVSKSIRS